MSVVFVLFLHAAAAPSVKLARQVQCRGLHEQPPARRDGVYIQREREKGLVGGGRKRERVRERERERESGREREREREERERARGIVDSAIQLSFSSARLLPFLSVDLSVCPPARPPARL